MRLRILLWLTGAAAAGVLIVFAGIELAASLLPPPSIARYKESSQQVLNSDGRLLRAFLTSDQKWRFQTDAGGAPKAYLDLLIAYEDKRFWSHNGIDHFALFRALWQLVLHRKAISGGSTLTMQVARLLDRQPRGIRAKIKQLVAARQLERKYTKKQILSMYLTLAPFGGNIEGIRAASLIYFEKDPKDLTEAESALLIALPQAPEARRPDIWPQKSLAARNRVVRLALASGAISGAQASAIAAQPFKASRNGMIILAAHAAEAAHKRFPNRPVVKTTIDGVLQAAIEKLARDAYRGDLSRVSMAILVVRNSDMAVRGYLSGPFFFSDVNAGQVDLVTAIRSPGSALKPFVYGLAFEKLIAHPLTIVVDGPTRFGGYEPKNFSDEFNGEVTVHDALIRSINTTAVTILAKVGPERLMTRLHQAGIDLRVDDLDKNAGLAIALGGCGISLADLAKLYAGLANGGDVGALRLFPDDPARQQARLLSTAAAWAVNDILADAIPPDGFAAKQTAQGGRRIAYKTGTSYNFRDAWAAGYDKLHTVVVWVGRPDGAPNPGSSGRHSAAPALLQIFDLLPVPEEDVAGPPPAGTILSQRTNLPPRLERLSMLPAYLPAQPLNIAFPPEGARIFLGSGGEDDKTMAPLQAKGGKPPYIWDINGKLTAQQPGQSTLNWRPATRGQYRARVLDSAGSSASVDFWVE